MSSKKARCKSKKKCECHDHFEEFLSVMKESENKHEFKDIEFVSSIDATAAQSGRAYCTSYPACMKEFEQSGDGTKDKPFDIARLYNLQGVKEHHILMPMADDKGYWDKYVFKHASITRRKDRITPLALASYLCKPHMVKRLISMRHGVNCQSLDGSTPLIEAIVSNTKRQDDRLETVKALLINGASANIQTRANGDTALTIAAWRGDVEVVRLLQEYAFKIRWNLKTKRGHTALHIAVYRKHWQLIRFMLQHHDKFDILATNQDGLCCLDFCMLWGGPIFMKFTNCISTFFAYQNKLKTYILRLIRVTKKLIMEMNDDQPEEEQVKAERLFCAVILACTYLSCFRDVRDAIISENVIDFLQDFLGTEDGEDYFQEVAGFEAFLLKRLCMYGEFDKIKPMLKSGFLHTPEPIDSKCRDVAENLLFLLLVKSGVNDSIEILKRCPNIFRNYEKIGGVCIKDIFSEDEIKQMHFIDIRINPKKPSKMEKMFIIPKPYELPNSIYNITLDKLKVCKEVKAFVADNNMKSLIAEEEAQKKKAEARKEAQRRRAQKKAAKRARQRAAQKASPAAESTEADSGSEDEEEAEKEEEAPPSPQAQDIPEVSTALNTAVSNAPFLITRKELRKQKKEQKKLLFQQLQQKNDDMKAQKVKYTNEQAKMQRIQKHQDSANQAKQAAAKSTRVQKQYEDPKPQTPEKEKKGTAKWGKPASPNTFTKTSKDCSRTNARLSDYIAKSYFANVEESMVDNEVWDENENLVFNQVKKENNNDEAKSERLFTVVEEKSENININRDNNTQIQKENVLKKVANSKEASVKSLKHDKTVKDQGGSAQNKNGTRAKPVLAKPRPSHFNNLAKTYDTAGLKKRPPRFADKAHNKEDKSHEKQVIPGLNFASVKEASPVKTEDDMDVFKDPAIVEMKCSDLANGDSTVLSLSDHGNMENENLNSTDQAKSVYFPSHNGANMLDILGDFLRVDAAKTPESGSEPKKSGAAENVDRTGEKDRQLNTLSSKYQHSTGHSLDSQSQWPSLVQCNSPVASAGTSERNKTEDRQNLQNQRLPPGLVPKQLLSHWSAASPKQIFKPPSPAQAANNILNSGEPVRNLNNLDAPQSVEKKKSTEESGYNSPMIAQHNSGGDNEAKMANAVAVPRLFAQNWIPRSKRWHAHLQKVANSSHTEKVGSLNFYLRDNSCLISMGSCGTTVTVGIRDDGTEVAIKRMVKCFSQLIKNELANLRRPDLDHPNIIKYRDYVEDQNFAYLALELCEGTLDEKVRLLAKRGTLEKNAMPLCQQLLTGLAALHDAKILHMDLKPRNVLIDTKGRVKLADFGLSQQLDDSNSTYYHATQNGTKCWRPLETLNGPPGAGIMNRYKQASDIFVAGMIFYYIVTGGLHPFGNDATSCELNIQRGAIPNTSCLKDRVFVDLLYCMLHPNMNQRVSAREALWHPYFWDDQKRLEFLVKVGTEREIHKPEAGKLLDYISTTMNGGTCTQNWGVMFNANLIEYMGWTPGQFFSIVDILTLVIPALDDADQKPLEQLLGGRTLRQHVAECFPSLFIVVYEALVRHDWTSKRSMRTYFYTPPASNDA